MRGLISNVVCYLKAYNVKWVIASVVVVLLTNKSYYAYTIDDRKTFNCS
jgi:hypothetical protein